MEFHLRTVATTALLSLCGLVHAQTNWQPFVSNMDPGISTSPVSANLPNDLAIEAPASDLSPELARWSGKWRGWACQDQTCDTRLAVERVTASGASIVYTFASATIKPVIARAEAKFVGNELQASFPSGTTIAYRFRKSGDIEFHWQKNSSWSTGVLSKEK